MNTYKEQFTEWSPAYPVVFHTEVMEVSEFNKGTGSVMRDTLKAHNITIKAIIKAMEHNNG